MAGRRTELIMQLVELWNSGDIDGFVDSVGPEFEFTPDPSFPDVGTNSIVSAPWRRPERDWLTRQSIGYALCYKAWLREETD